MNRSLPSLTGLRGFEAVARHLSFTEAAKELEVTQTAVSHQIRSLESQLGLKLFHRKGKLISLTDAAKSLLPAASQSFDTLELALNDIQGIGKSALITVSVSPNFTRRWLIHRLGEFWHENPDIQLNIHHSIDSVSFPADGIDAGIRIGHGDWPELNSHYLFSFDLHPVCHSSIIDTALPLDNPDNLEHFTLLHESNYEDWIVWTRITESNKSNPRSGLMFTDRDSLLQAVQQAKGMALVTLDEYKEIEHKQELVLPFRLDMNGQISYYLVYPPENLKKPILQRFIRFVVNGNDEH